MVVKSIRGSSRIECPYSPKAEWRIAISRRFNHTIVDDLYYRCILPVLRGEGLLMECHYAAETPEEYDYWVNRFSIILELSDIHILMDIDRTANMELEFQKSQRHARQGMASALAINFGWVMTYPELWMRPIRIIVTKTKSGKMFRYGRQRVVHISDTATTEEIAQDLRREIRWAKRLKLFDIRLAEYFFEKPCGYFGYEKEIEPTLVAMTALARKFAEGASVDELMPLAQNSAISTISTGYQGPIIIANEANDLALKIYEGTAEVPTSFLGKVRFLQGSYKDSINKMSNTSFISKKPDYEKIDQDFLSTLLLSWWFNKLVFINAVLGAIKITVLRRNKDQ